MINLSSIWLCFCLYGWLYVNGKKQEKSTKIIASFSEADISDRLPNPDSVAEMIPKSLILKNHSPSKRKEMKIGQKQLIESRILKGRRSSHNLELSDPDIDVPKNKSMHLDKSDSDDSSIEYVSIDSFETDMMSESNILPTATLVSLYSKTHAHVQASEIASTTVRSSEGRNFSPLSRQKTKRAENSSSHSGYCFYPLLLLLITFTVLICIN